MLEDPALSQCDPVLVSYCLRLYFDSADIGCWVPKAQEIATFRLLRIFKEQVSSTSHQSVWRLAELLAHWGDRCNLDGVRGEPEYLNGHCFFRQDTVTALSIRALPLALDDRSP